MGSFLVLSTKQRKKGKKKRLLRVRVHSFSFVFVFFLQASRVMSCLRPSSLPRAPGKLGKTTTATRMVGRVRVRCEPTDKPQEQQGGVIAESGANANANAWAKDKYEEWKRTSSVASLQPEAFKIQEGYTWKLVGASIPTLTTALAGAFSPGYKGQLKKKSDNETENDRYVLPVSLGGYRWEEEQSFVGKVPEQPVTIYEFQGCPFAGKCASPCPPWASTSSSSLALQGVRRGDPKPSKREGNPSSPTWSIQTQIRKCTSQATSLRICSRNTGPVRFRRVSP